MSYQQRMDLIRLGWLLAYVVCPPLVLVMAYLGRGWRQA